MREEVVMDLFEIRESIKESVYGSCDYITKLDIKLWMEEVNTSKYFGLGTEVEIDWLYEELKQLKEWEEYLRLKEKFEEKTK